MSGNKQTWTADPSSEVIKSPVQSNEARAIVALERIATATEEMGKQFIGPMSSRDWYKKVWEEELELTAKQARTIAGLRGCVARMKRERKAGAK
jgi:hypothetical protein